MFGLELSLSILLVFCLLAACIFEFINGFHDTANAVASVIYTNSLTPRIAVIWSGICNFLGVMTGGIAVAMGIVNLLPTEMLIESNLAQNVSMILALIFTAILWNIGTWYFGMPCSSSHTLIGSIFGVGISYIIMTGNPSVGLNWHKAQEVGLSLLISPLFGFAMAMFLMMLLKKIIKDKKIFKQPHEHKPPPFWIRFILVITCTGVSFSHGSNDGQKGVGLVMIILIAIIPVYFALDHSKHPEDMAKHLKSTELLFHKINIDKLSDIDKINYVLVENKIDSLKKIIGYNSNFKQIASLKHFEARRDIILIGKLSENIISNSYYLKNSNISHDEIKTLKGNIKSLKSYTEYAPWWVIFMISISLGLGTMIGWKRIVVTIGEKIGNSKLTYAQGATANIVATSTIGLSSFFGLPVSTTHVLSSGVAGTMVAGKGLKNLQKRTIRNIAIAWIVTLPVTTAISGFLFYMLRLLLT